MLEDKMRQCLLSLCCQHEKVQLCIAVEFQLLRAATHDYDAKSFSAAACLARSYLKGPKQPHSAHLHVQVLLSQVIEGGEGPVTPRPLRKKIYISCHLF